MDPLARLQHLCSRAEKCVADVQKKLLEWNVPAIEATAIIRQLQAQGFIDEARYARAFVRDKNGLAHWGRKKIGQALQAKKIAAALVEEALGEIDEEAYKKELEQLLKRKNAALKVPTNTERKVKLLRLALSRGYEYTLAYAAVSELIKE